MPQVEQGSRYTDMISSFGPLQAAWAGITSKNMTFVGSANMSAFYMGDKILIVMADVKSMYSFIYHATTAYDHFRDPNNLSTYPYGNTYQFYIFTVDTKSQAWYQQQKKVLNKDGFRPANYSNIH